MQELKDRREQRRRESEITAAALPKFAEKIDYLELPYVMKQSQCICLVRRNAKWRSDRARNWSGAHHMLPHLMHVLLEGVAWATKRSIDRRPEHDVMHSGRSHPVH